MKHILKITLPLLCLFFITNHASASCDNPQSIEEAVVCSGGTYGVIDTSHHDAVNNFADILVNQGLTNIDVGDSCQSFSVRTGVAIHCELSINNDAYYYYEGKKGEKVTVTVVSSNLNKTFDISFENQSIGLHADNESIVDYNKNTKTRILKSTLQYDGAYTIKVSMSGHENNVGEPFTIRIDSDKSGIVPDIRKDSLVEGNTYSVYELNQNQATSSRVFEVDAYVVGIYEAPNCPPLAPTCKVSVSPNITIADNNQLGGLASEAYQARLWIDKKYEDFFEYNKLYKFKVTVKNNSVTNIPDNEFRLVTVKSFDERVHTAYALAQTSSANCLVPDRNVGIGSVDAYDGAVSFIQNLLVREGLLFMPAGVQTGYFGNMTQTALASYQARMGIYPATGYFGPLTRAHLRSQCNTSYILDVEAPTKIVSLVTTKREPPASDPNYRLTSDLLRIGNDASYIYLTFDPDIQGNESLENFRSSLELGSTVVHISLPEKAVAGADSDPVINESDPHVRQNLEVDFSSYKNGKLIGTLTTKAKKASYWMSSSSSGCSNGDQFGMCVRSIPLDINLVVNFEVQVK